MISEDPAPAVRRLSRRIVAATHNAGKLGEIKELLSPYGIDAIGAAALGLAEPEETGLTFRDNAVLKARAAAGASGEAALADDSGLCVAGLGGAPGIHSARWAGAAKDFAKAMARIERELLSAGAPRPWWRTSSARWRSLGPTGGSRFFRAALTASWFSRRAAPKASVTTRYSGPTAIREHLAR